MIKRIFIIVLLFSFSFQSYADEGMWLPMLIKRLNHADMQKMGLNLTAEEIYSVNNSSLKDAIVSLGGFCTAEVISKQGLLLTNHHCAFSAIQAHSTVENDFITHGFWAATHEDEKPNEGLYAKFLVRMEDVTKSVLAGVTDAMTESERASFVNKAIERIKGNVEGNYEIEIKPFYEGNEYYMFLYEIYRDVRLVGAPPSSIGKFGGDTDNWMWPRQTGDFALFRVYTAPDGSPAEYSPENIPLKPKHHLPISLDGVQENDFAMVMGYPGSTDRYLSSYGARLVLDQTNPTRVAIREKRLAILKDDMDASENIRIKYASKYARVSNYWKYFIGQTQGLKSLNVVEDKEKIEEEFQAWANANSQRKAQYGDVLANIKGAYETIEQFNVAYLYLVEAAFGSEILTLANSFSALANLLNDPDKNKDKIAEQVTSLQEEANKFFKDYNAPTDKKVLAALIEMYYHDLPKAQQPETLLKIGQTYNEDFVRWAGDVFDNSIFDEEDKVHAFLENPARELILEDPAYKIIRAIMDHYYDDISPQLRVGYNQLNSANRLFIKGLREMNPDRKYYPNANSTMRLTYGQVKSYAPRDGVVFKYYTTLEGVMEKEDPNHDEFVVPEKLKTLYQNKDYGPYSDGGIMPVCFISNNDITGGNSGSPVMNGDGALVGIAFDGNWEAMSGDIAFESELQRAINVDIRYVLFIIDKFADAGHLVDEMTLIKTAGTKKEKPSRKKTKVK